MALNGNLSEFSVLETLQVIALQQKTGTLQVSSGKKRVGLHFRDGALIGCQPANPKDPDPFLETLSGLGQCGRDEERRIRILAGEAGTDLWRQIGNSVKLEPETLEETRGLVLQGTLDRVLLWNRGHFKFESGPVPPASGPPWNVEQALLESMRRLDEAADLKSGGFPLNSIAVPVQDSMDGRQPTEEDSEFGGTPPALERAILTRLDGRRTFGDLVKQIKVAEYDILSAMRDLRDRRLIRIESTGREISVTQILLEQPRRLRNPALAVFLLVTMIFLITTGWQVHNLTNSRMIPTQDARARDISSLRTVSAIHQSLELYRQREGVYPRELDQLVETGIWPAERADRLDGQPYSPLSDRAGYRWEGEDRLRIQSAAAAR